MKNTTFITTFLFIFFCLTGCSPIKSAESSSYSTSQIVSAANDHSTISDSSLWKKSSDNTWDSLQHTPLHALEEAQITNNDPSAKGWLALAILSKKYSTNTQQLVTGLQEWRNTYPSHPGNKLIPDNTLLNQLLSASPPRHIAILLPLNGPLASSGRMIRNGFLSAYYDSSDPTSPKQVLSFYDTNQDPNIATVYQKAISEGADTVIGPLTKPEVENLLRLNHFETRIIALNYTPPKFFSSLPTNFYEFGFSPVEETQQMANKAYNAGLSQALVIAPSDDWGQRVTDTVVTQWQSRGGKIVDTLRYTSRSNLTQDIAALLHINPKEDRELTREDNTKTVLSQQRRQDFDVIFVFAQPDMGRQIIPLLRFYYAGHVPIYSISSIYSGRPNPIKDKDLNGVIFCEVPWIIQKAHAPSSNAAEYDRFYAIGRDAYLLSHALPRMNILRNFPLYGATGALEVDQQQIHQRLPWVTMHGGQI